MAVDGDGGCAGSVPQTSTGSPAAGGHRAGVVHVDAGASIHQVTARNMRAGVEVAQAEAVGDAREVLDLPDPEVPSTATTRSGAEGARTVRTGCGSRRGSTTGGSTQPRDSRRAPAGARHAPSSTTSSTSPTGRPGSWSMRTSSMLTPLSPASANSRASSPGWSGTETKTERVGRGGPPCLPGMARVPSTPRASTALQAVAVAAADSADHLRRAASRTSASSAQHRLGVGGDDLAVERRVAGRDPGHVAHALAATARGGRAGASIRRAATSGGEQVRHVGGAGHGPVVLVGGERHRHRAAQGRPAPPPAPTADGSEPRAGSSPTAAVEERRGGGEGAGALAARHRVAADVARDAGRGRRPRPAVRT